MLVTDITLKQTYKKCRINTGLSKYVKRSCIVRRPQNLKQSSPFLHHITFGSVMQGVGVLRNKKVDNDCCSFFDALSEYMNFKLARAVLLF